MSFIAMKMNTIHLQALKAILRQTLQCTRWKQYNLATILAAPNTALSCILDRPLLWK